MCFSFSAVAQELPATSIPTTAVKDTIVPNIDTTLQTRGTRDNPSFLPGSTSSSVINPMDTVKTESSSDKVFDNSLGVKLSKDGLDDIIDYGSKDSSYTDLKTNKIHLFGEAFVKYQKYDLKAGYIIFDLDNNEASAFTIKNAKGADIQKPDFTDGTNKFKSSGLRFNFDTNKGLIYDAVTQEGEFTIHGKRTKFVSKDSDSTAVNDQIFNKDAIITTCTADHPHYGIRARKLKVVPNKLAIIGLSQVEIMGIPTPLILPFGFFPLVQGRSNGLILPNNFEYDQNLGIGFREIGYYFPINDYMDLRITGDIYTRGSHRLNVLSNYRKRYKYNGNVRFSYTNNVGENPVDGKRTFNKAFSLRVTHNQDSKAHPYINVGGTINLSTNLFDQVNSVNADEVVNNKINSNFYYKHAMPGTPFSFSAAFTHFQDNSTRKVDITLPDAKLRMNTIYPFKSKSGGKEGWYERINLSYDAKFKNYIKATDTTLFTKEVWENMQTGLSHNASTSFNTSLLKYININTSANFEQFVLTRTERRELDDKILTDSVVIGEDQLGDPEYRIDTTYGQINDVFRNGLQTVEKFRMNMNASTSLFATKTFSKGWLRGLRHITSLKESIILRLTVQKRNSNCSMLLM